MKRKFLLSLLACLLCIILPLSRVFTNAAIPPAGRTGVTLGINETTCGTSACHNNTPNSGSGSLAVTFSNADLKYIPGETYEMTVTTSEAGKVKFGFEITCVDANGDSVGTFIIPSGVTNISKPSAGAVNHRQYLGHKTATSNNTWSFEWKAPAIDKGQLAFFIASNCANGNGNDAGDHIYTTSLFISPDNTNGIFSPDLSGDPFSIQSIASNQITLEYDQPSNDRVVICLYDLNGRPIQTLFDGDEGTGLHTHTFPLTRNLISGLYLVRYSSGNVHDAKKIFIQK